MSVCGITRHINRQGTGSVVNSPSKNHQTARRTALVFFSFIFNAICHCMLWQTVGVTYQPFHYAPSIAHLSCLISISFRRSSVSLSMFICRVNCTPSIKNQIYPLAPAFMFRRHFRSEHRAPRAPSLRH